MPWLPVLLPPPLLPVTLPSIYLLPVAVSYNQSPVDVLVTFSGGAEITQLIKTDVAESPEARIRGGRLKGETANGLIYHNFLQIFCLQVMQWLQDILLNVVV